MAAPALSSKALSSQTVRPRVAAAVSRGRVAVVVRAEAQPLQPHRLSRRAAVSLLALPAAALLPQDSWALIPDDDDEELVAKAKANRKSRLQQDREQDKTFLKGEGISSSQETAGLVPVQKAIAELAKAGSQLEEGNLSAAAASMDGAWVKDFRASASKLSSTEASKASLEQVLSSLDAAKQSAKANKAPEAKGSFVHLVDSLQSWVESEGVASKLRGL